MFCPNCGTQLSDEMAFCPNCGSQVGAAQQPAAAQPYDPAQQPTAAQPYDPAQQAQSQPYQQPYQQPEPQPYQQQYQQSYQQPAQQPGAYTPVGGANTSYQSLGGWLLFFVVIEILGAVSNILSGLSTFTSLGGVPVSYHVALIVSGLAAIAIGLMQAAFAYFVIKRNSIFLRYYQIMSIASIALSVIVSILAASSLGISGIIGGVIGLVLMTMYYCKSVRVRTYMGSTSYLDQALFKIGA